MAQKDYWKVFFSFTWPKLIIFIVLLLLLPFFSFKDDNSGSCTQSIPGSCTTSRPLLKLEFTPLYIIDTFGIAFGSTSGSSYRGQIIFVNILILLAKLILSLLIACKIGIIFNKR